MIRLPGLATISAVLCLAGSPALQQSGACRTYSIKQVGQVTSSDGRTGKMEQTCAPFNRSSNSVRCTLNQTYGSVNLTQAITGYYKSVDEFVDEVRVNPPLMRMTRQETTSQQGQTRLDIFYDGQNRPLKSVLTSGNGLQNSQFGLWDKAGRYTEVNITSADAPPERVIYAYDDARRIMTITNKRIGFIGVYTYDENGNLVKTITTDASGQRTIAVTIGANDKICKG